MSLEPGVEIGGGLAAKSAIDASDEPKADVKNNSAIKRTGTINKAKQLEEQKQNEKRKTLFGVRNPIIQPIDNSKSEGNNFDASEFNLAASSMQSQIIIGQNNVGPKAPKYDIIIIKEKQKWKAIFDVVINAFVLYNTFQITLELCFSIYAGGGLDFFQSYILELSFALDIFFNFLMEFKDPETQQPVREFTLIAKNYILKSSFIADFIAIIPVDLFSDGQSEINKLFRMVRITRILKLLDIQRMNHLLKSFFENDSSQDKIMLQYLVMYAFKIARLFILAIIITYFCGCIWYMVIKTYKNEEDETFWYEFNMEDKNIYDRLIVCWYYSMTTLTTVGYGDYYPKSNTEIFVAVCYMLCGVVFFSYIMSSVIEIINNQQKKMSLEDKSQGLRNWLTLLSRFTNKKPLPRSLYNRISQHFDYFWTYDRLAAIHQHSETLNELPKSMKRKLMTNYLFEDIFKNFKFFFKSTKDSNREQKFLYDVSYGFLPREFDPENEKDDEIIYNEEDEVPEMYFCLEGIVSVGYFFGSGRKTKHDFKAVKKFVQMFIICDHYVVNNLRCEFVFKCEKVVKCFALTKKFLLKNIFKKYPEIANEIKANAHARYQKYLKRPIKEQFKKDITMKNKKSTYNQVHFEEKSDGGAGPSSHNHGKLGHATAQNVPAEEMNLIDKNKKQAKENDLEMNSQLKKKMTGIRNEVQKFNKNIDKFSIICDNELIKLYENVESVSKNTEKGGKKENEKKEGKK